MRLEVGTVIYEDYGSDGLFRYEITRVTEKQAMATIPNSINGAEIKFKREINESFSFCAIGGNKSWFRSRYSIETPELKEKFKSQILKERVRKLNFKALNPAQLEQILKIAEGESE